MLEETTLKQQSLAFCNQYSLLKNLTIMPFANEKTSSTEKKKVMENGNGKVGRKLEKVKKKKQDNAHIFNHQPNQSHNTFTQQNSSMLQNLINELGSKNTHNQLSSRNQQNTGNFYYPNNYSVNNNYPLAHNPYANYSPNQIKKSPKNWINQLNYTNKYATKPSWAYQSPKISKPLPSRSFSPLSIYQSGNIPRDRVHTPKNRKGERPFYETKVSPLKKSTSQNKINQIQHRPIDIMGKLQQAINKQRKVEKNEFKIHQRPYTEYHKKQDNNFQAATQNKNRQPQLDDDLQLPISYISQSRTVPKPIPIDIYEHK